MARRRKSVLCRVTILLTLTFVVFTAWNRPMSLVRVVDEVVSYHNVPPSSFAKCRLLFIVTTLAEYDTGRRQTTKGWDRFAGIMLPVIQESVESIISVGISHIDVYIVAHYNLTKEKEDRIRRALPHSVGLQVWNDATPLGYPLEERGELRKKIQPITRGLARQHRYVIKDKLPYYDIFCVFEDDMLVTGSAVSNYYEMTNELYRLRSNAPNGNPMDKNRAHDDINDVFYGIMTKDQLKRMMPGFIRVEVLLNGRESDTQKTLDPIPITDRPDIDPSCCRWNNVLTESDTRPATPTSDQLILWETGIRALGIRKLPLNSNIDWVVLQRGPRVAEPRNSIGDYWSGRDRYYEPDFVRPDTKDFDFINNQGGWMATRQQIFDWHSGNCPGGLLPPYDPLHFPFDGLDLRNVEYWSGGMHLVTSQNGCNLQRVIALDPAKFAESLLYHTSNNKQRQFGSGRWQKKLVKVNDLLGQLNTVKANAEAEMNRRVTAMNRVFLENF